MPTKEFILSEIRRTAEANDGKPLGRRAFENDTGLKEWDWGRYWPKWSDAILEAGLDANEFNSALDIDQTMRILAETVREYGKYPSQAELRFKRNGLDQFPSKSWFTSRLGTKRVQLEHLLQFCHEKPEFDDVRRICEIELAGLAEQTPAKGETQQTDSADSSGLVRGFVYLIKSGRAYKIGATSDVEQRISAFNHQLPHAPQLVHQISTDDIFGIERYWHKRFESKKIRSEWFNLAAAEVAAFRKRKFM